MFRTYKLVPDSKSHLARVQKAIDRGEQTVSCKKCGAAHKTLRKIPYQGNIFYYCEDCIKQAMKKGVDVRVEEEKKDVRED